MLANILTKPDQNKNIESDTNEEEVQEETTGREEEVIGDAQEVMDEVVEEELENLSCQEEVHRNSRSYGRPRRMIRRPARYSD